MQLALVGRIGKITLDRSQSYIQMTSILGRALKGSVRFSFLNRAVRRVLIRQLYFTSVQALPVIFLTALILGSITVNYLLALLTGLGSYDRIGDLLITVMLHELAPIACTLIMLLRSGTAIISEVALMKINRELDSLQMLGIDLGNYVFLPRILAFVVSAPALTFCFSLVGLIGGFFILGFVHHIPFDSYLDQLLLAVQEKDFLIMVTKPSIMALAVVLLCIQKGMTVRTSFTEVPVKLIQGMMHTISIIIFIEILYSLLV